MNARVTTEDHREEPIKVTTIPSKPWSTVALDHGGPYPDGQYNLVMIDKRTRYPVVEAVPSTNFEVNKGRFKHIFATYGTPRRIETDNGPPFNSKEFKESGKQEGFEHHKITPLHPRANGEAERFMQTLNKVERIAHLQGKNRYERQNAIQDMLVAYRSTPNPATGLAPYDAMRGCIIRTKLDHVEPKEGNVEGDDQIRRKDATYKQKMKKQREGKKTREAALLLGDYVLVKQPKKNKWTTPYEPVFYVVREIRGSQITARRITDGRTVCRDASQFKVANSVMETMNDNELTEEEKITIIQNRDEQNMQTVTQQSTVTNERNTSQIREEVSNVEERNSSSEGDVRPEQEQIQEKEHLRQLEDERINIQLENEQKERLGREQPEKGRPKKERRKPAYLDNYLLYWLIKLG